MRGSGPRLATQNSLRERRGTTLRARARPSYRANGPYRLLAVDAAGHARESGYAAHGRPPTHAETLRRAWQHHRWEQTLSRRLQGKSSPIRGWARRSTWHRRSQVHAVTRDRPGVSLAPALQSLPARRLLPERWVSSACATSPAVPGSISCAAASLPEVSFQKISSLARDAAGDNAR